jgi:hypothetical protein
MPEAVCPVLSKFLSTLLVEEFPAKLLILRVIAASFASGTCPVLYGCCRFFVMAGFRCLVGAGGAVSGARLAFTAGSVVKERKWWITCRPWLRWGSGSRDAVCPPIDYPF